MIRRGAASWSPLSREKLNLIGVQFCKHENYQPVGAFKVRGGINLISQLSPAERERGVIAASTGNHGQSVAYAARLFGVKARIVVPEGANPGKVAAMQGMGPEALKGVSIQSYDRHDDEFLLFGTQVPTGCATR